MSFDVGQYSVPSGYTNDSGKTFGVVRVDTLVSGATRGSTNTFMPCFFTIRQYEGTSITYFKDAVKGDYFRINESGVYAMLYNDGGGQQYVITANLSAADQTASGNANITDKSRILAYGFAPSSAVGVVSWTGPLKAGDLIRPMADSGVGFEDDHVKFSICRVA